MANLHTSLFPSGLLLSNNKNEIFTDNDLYCSGWEIIEGEELFYDVISLDSFSVSSQSEEGESMSNGVDPNAMVDSLLSDGVDLNTIMDSVSVSSQSDERKTLRAGVNTNTIADSALDLPLLNINIYDIQHNHHLDLVRYASQLLRVIKKLPLSSDFVTPGYLVNDDDMREELPSPRNYVARLEPRTTGSFSIFDSVKNSTVHRDDHHVYIHDQHHPSGDVEDCDDGENYGYLTYDVDNEDEDGGCGSEVDDELVPWEISNRLEKQRMKKLGKRSCAKMKNSKKLAHAYVQSASARGKHGLGLKVY